MTGRRRLPWVWGVVAVALAGALGTAALFRWQARRARAAMLADVERAHEELGRCLLGARVPDAELGRRVMEAEVTGAIDRARVARCGEALERAARALEREHDREVPRFLPEPSGVPDADDRHGVCAALARARSELAARRGRPRPSITCRPALDELAPTTAEADGEDHRRWTDGGDLYLDVVSDDSRLPTHQLRRSRDGGSWEELAAPAGHWQPHWSGEGGWTYGFVGGADSARYHVLDGTSWRAGAPARAGREIAWRRTDSGWTIVLERKDGGAEVVWLDPWMERVAAVRAVPGLRRGPGADGTPLLAAVDARGDAIVFQLTTSAAGAARLEAHPVSRAGGSRAPVVEPLEVDGAAQQAGLVSCRAGETTYLVLSRRAAMVSTAEAPLAVIARADLPAPRALACAGGRLSFTDGRRLARCDASACGVEAVPLAAGALGSAPSDPLAMDLADEAGRLRLLVAARRRAYLLEDGATPGLRLARIWSWDGDRHHRQAPTLRLGGSWFLL